MKLKGFAISTTMLVLTGVHSAGSAQTEQTKPTAEQKMASVDYLIGTWTCAHTVGTFSGTYTTTYSRALGDRWLRQIWNFPAEKTSERITPAISAEALIGYDEARQMWVRFFANSLGRHFETRLTDVPNGWTYKYTTFFTRANPETPEPDATFTKKSDADYTIDGPTYPKGDALVTEHHMCHKL